MNRLSFVALKSPALLALLLVSLTACEVGPDYERPPVETPAAYKESGDWTPAAPNDGKDRGPWWSIYNDTILDGLMRQIDINNQNLKAAEAAYRQATATLDETRASLFPTLDLSGTGTRSGNNANQANNNFSSTLQATWAPDIWGRVRRGMESDTAAAEASAADLANIRLSAQTTLASSYFDLRVQDEIRRLLNRTVENDKKILQIVRDQYTAGITAKSDVLAAETQLESVQSTAVNADLRRAQLEHAIAVLIGQPPASFSLADNNAVNPVPLVPTEVPSSLLQRRPDIAAAERQMAAANATIGVEVAAWYPNLTLAASYGTGATMLSKILQASNSLWSVGPTIAETIFDAGARDARIDQARATYDQTVANYRQTTLTAFQQVEDNLAAQRVLSQQSAVQQAAVSSARQTEDLTLLQYKQGIVPYSNVLTAQTTTLGNEQIALNVLSSQLEASVNLIGALGGGWDAKDLKEP